MWMIIVCLLKFPKMLSIYISEIVETSEHTLVDWGNYIRNTISNFYFENPLILGGGRGDGDRKVQIDESLFGGKRKYHRGNHHIHKKSWVVGIIEEGSNRCVFLMIDCR